MPGTRKWCYSGYKVMAPSKFAVAQSPTLSLLPKGHLGCHGRAQNLTAVCNDMLHAFGISEYIVMHHSLVSIPILWHAFVSVCEVSIARPAARHVHG